MKNRKDKKKQKEEQIFILKHNSECDFKALFDLYRSTNPVVPKNALLELYKKLSKLF